MSNEDNLSRQNRAEEARQKKRLIGLLSGDIASRREAIESLLGRSEITAEGYPECLWYINEDNLSSNVEGYQAAKSLMEREGVDPEILYNVLQGLRVREALPVELLPRISAETPVVWDRKKAITDSIRNNIQALGIGLLAQILLGHDFVASATTWIIAKNSLSIYYAYQSNRNNKQL